MRAIASLDCEVASRATAPSISPHFNSITLQVMNSRENCPFAGKHSAFLEASNM
jgi:hypothetical protein